ncbi:MAG: hypothetical protein WBD89_01465, partial [Candidatus Sulfotelmatobacter sp.]
QGVSPGERDAKRKNCGNVEYRNRKSWLHKILKASQYVSPFFLPGSRCRRSFWMPSKWTRCPLLIRAQENW